MNIKGKELINISAIGIISGFLVGLVKAAPQVAANRYIQYKMFTLTALSFREITYYIIYFTAGLALLHIAATFVFKYMKWKKEKIFMLETMLLVPIMGAFIIDHLLRTFTYYTLGLGIQRFFRALAGLFSGENGISGFLQLLKKNIAAFLFFAVGIAAIVIFFRLALKINWNRAAQFMENNPPGMCCMRYMRYIRRTAFVLITAFLLLNAGLLIRGEHTPDGSPNIVLIVVDCLRADHLGYYGCHRNTSPVIDRLAKEGMVFENAFSNTSWTKPSVASLFTSLYPNRHGVITMTDIFPVPFLTMAEILKNNGYYTACFIGGNSFLREEFNFQQGFDLFKNDGYEESSANLLTDSFLDAVSPPSQRKFFAYIHYMDVHLPYHKNEYNGLFMEKGIKTPFTPFEFGKHSLRESTAGGTLPEETKNRLVSVYDGQIRCVDEQIGKIISVLKQRNMLENTLVVITSDHGEEFWEHNNFEHGHTLYNELIHVPLILVGNKLTHKKVKTPVTLVDLLPTFLARANIRNGTLKLQGNDLLNSRETGGRKAFASGTLYNDEKYCLIDEENWKLIINTGDETEKNKLIGFSNKDQLELYDLNSDPLEKKNLKDAEPAKLVRLRKELEQRINVKSIFKRKKTIIDRKTRDRLKSLGYL